MQLLCGTNKKRFILNNYVRKVIYPDNTSYFPLAGEIIMCLKNSRMAGVFNGQFFTCVDHSLLGVSNANGISYMDLKEVSLTISDEAGNINNLTADFWYFKASSEKDTEVLKQLQFEQSNFGCDGIPFDFAHCITVHKSQGSQWNEVIVFDESKIFKADKNKWLYTAITRAAKKIWLLK